MTTVDPTTATALSKGISVKPSLAITLGRKSDGSHSSFSEHHVIHIPLGLTS
jgi:hypothetical protein